MTDQVRGAWAGTAAGFALSISTLLAQSPGDPSWRQISDIGGMGAEGIYEENSTGNIVLIGGFALGLRTWRWQGSWTEIIDPVPPEGRDYSAFVYDRSRGVAVLFGGMSFGPLLDDTWEFDGQSWQRRQLAMQPSARFGAASAYDPVRQRMVLYGGSDLVTDLQDTWEFDGVQWTLINPATAPQLRAHASMTFDHNLQKVLLVGATTGTNPASQTWTYDGSNWQQLSPLHAPPAARQAEIQHDPLRGRSVLLGGYDLNQTQTVTDTWTFDGTDWQQLQTVGQPLGVFSNATAWLPSLGAVVTFGGHGQGFVPPYSSALYAFDGADWLQWTREVPFCREEPQVAFDSARQRLILHGGMQYYQDFRNDTFEWDGRAWQQTSSNTGPRTPMAYDPSSARVVAVEDGSTWTYDGAWSSAALSPSPTRGYSIWFDRHEQAVRVLEDGELWTYRNQSWSAVPIPNAPTSPGPTLAVHLTAQDQTFIRPPLWPFVMWRLADNQVQVHPAPSHYAYVRSFVEDPRIGAMVGIDSDSKRTRWFDGSQWLSKGFAPHEELRDLSVAQDYATGRVLGVNPTGTVWELTWPDAQTLTRFGTGCAGPGGMPTLAGNASTAPTLGQPLMLNLSNLAPSTGLVVLAFGDSIASSQGQPLPQELDALGAPGCRAWVSMLTSQLHVHPGGGTTILVSLPADPTLAGVLIGMQALLVDPAGGGAAAITASNALLMLAR